MFVRTALVCLWHVARLTAEPVPAELDAAITKTLHQVEQRGGVFAANNPRQHMGARFYWTHTELTHRGGRFSMRLEGHAVTAAPQSSGNWIETRHGDVTEWFVNDAAGMEHGFTVARKLETGPLSIVSEVSGDYSVSLEGAVIVLRRDDGVELRHGGLASWDATGRMLPSRAEVDGGRIRLVVDDAEARYPVTVDPVFEEPPLRISSSSAGDKVGYSVAVSGDTAAVGAPTIQNELGTVYTYVRQGGAWKLQEVVAGYLHYGSSVALSGDTLVIGSPYDEWPSYTGTKRYDMDAAGETAGQRPRHVG